MRSFIPSLCCALAAFALASCSVPLSEAEYYAAKSVPNQITISGNVAKVNVNASPFSLVANLLPSTASQNDVIWSSSDTSVATVDSAGLVTPVSIGSTVISACSNSISKDYAKSSFDLSVYATSATFFKNKTVGSFYAPRSIVISPSGILYIADTVNHTIRKISGGVMTTIAGRAGYTGSSDGTGSAALFGSIGGLAVDSGGNLFIVDSSNYTIRKMTPDGVVSTIAGSAGSYGSTNGTGSAARFRSPTDVAIDTAGNLYITDTNSYMIRKITPEGVVSTFAGKGTCDTNDGAGTSAGFYALGDIVIDSVGNLFVADSNAIRKISSSGTVTTFAGDISRTGSGDGADVNARFNGIKGLAIDANNNLYVADFSNKAIRKVTSTGTVSTLVGTVTGSDSPSDGIVGVSANLSSPCGICIDSAGLIYVTDVNKNLLRCLDTSKGLLTTIMGVAGYYYGGGSDDGVSQSSILRRPDFVALDSSSTMYVSDTTSGVIKKITPDGTLSIFVGVQNSSGSTDGNKYQATFRSPEGIVIDASGTVYVADNGNYTIRKIASDGTVSTFAGKAGSFGTTDGNGSNARFYSLQGLTIDSSGNLYAVDSGYNSVRKITPTGTVSTLATRSNTASFPDEKGSTATLVYPYAVAVTDSGIVYVSDYHSIKKITAAGIVSCLAGSDSNSGTSDGQGSAARFMSLKGITVDSTGNVYVLDVQSSLSSVIRKVTPEGNTSTICSDGLGGIKCASGLGIDSTGKLYITGLDSSSGSGNGLIATLETRRTK